MESEKTFDSWVVVEVMGHQMHAGHGTQEVLFGEQMLRVDVPEVQRWPAHTKYVGGKAIFRLHIVSEEHARATAAELAKQWGYTPLPVSLPDMQAASETLRELRAAEQQRAPARIGPGAGDSEDGDNGNDFGHDLPF